ncbi:MULTISPECIES: hypothetical protein [Xanthomonas]|nr:MULTISPECIES: hypothetical protein [Xanthomonas]ATS38027.1 hypothetical protein XcfCFBP6988P_07755 [Xanthomonas citri pv. phaseoli var. fuscans]ATS43168.1 hypothetical protein XcfCFBP6989P_12720 [Xanthomonas citri pv. phaseoli var. fuscans]ATS46029.1 hypothetical protein XcfCFBP6990P_04630 [Xanthomonas citri pv. phaseoli var. fuscans]ATS83713.1 hypothetical protein XcfCFBP6991P_06830 [Xanthomonas citri pv. phaseoli var. fuscans]QWN19694.1 hypothetical protein DGM98_05640 [Xanthomonas citri]
MNLQRTIEIARAAAHLGEPGPLSTGEALTAALVLNRHDWLAEMGYTIAQVLDRIDSDTAQHLRDAERALRQEGL